jgi:hypothetical protein
VRRGGDIGREIGGCDITVVDTNLPLLALNRLRGGDIVRLLCLWIWWDCGRLKVVGGSFPILEPREVECPRWRCLRSLGKVFTEVHEQTVHAKNPPSPRELV